VSGVTAAGLLQCSHCSVGWHSITPCTTLAIGDERRSSSRHQSATTSRQLWLKVSRRIDYKLAVLFYKCLHGLAPSHLADELHHQAESEFRRRLRSASSHELSIPRTRLSTYADRAFPVAAVQIWNSLPQHITSSPSLPDLCCRLKTYFIELCYP